MNAERETEDASVSLWDCTMQVRYDIITNYARIINEVFPCGLTYWVSDLTI